MNTINTYTVATFYKFTALSKPAEVMAYLKKTGAEHQIKGTILLAKEGINATISGTDPEVMEMLALMEAMPEMGKLPYQLSYSADIPFNRYFVKVKPEIVALGRPDINPAERVGTYVAPDQWNELLKDPDVVVLDVRNDYEVEMGTFKGAINPRTDVFKDFPDYVERELDPKKHKKVAMFCTGGVRCEKASALMLEQGFEEVYHLKGGILHYITHAPEENLWQGDCFVFDDRIIV